MREKRKISTDCKRRLLNYTSNSTLTRRAGPPISGPEWKHCASELGIYFIKNKLPQSAPHLCARCKGSELSRASAHFSAAANELPRTNWTNKLRRRYDSCLAELQKSQDKRQLEFPIVDFSALSASVRLQLIDSTQGKA